MRRTIGLVAGALLCLAAASGGSEPGSPLTIEAPEADAVLEEALAFTVRTPVADAPEAIEVRLRSEDDSVAVRLDEFEDVDEERRWTGNLDGTRLPNGPAVLEVRPAAQGEEGAGEGDAEAEGAESWSGHDVVLDLPPPAFEVAAELDGDDVVLSWAGFDVPDLEGLRIERAPGEAEFAEVATLEADATAWTDPAPEPGPYRYRVTASRPGWNGEAHSTSAVVEVAVEDLCPDEECPADGDKDEEQDGGEQDGGEQGGGEQDGGEQDGGGSESKGGEDQGAEEDGANQGAEEGGADQGAEEDGANQGAEEGGADQGAEEGGANQGAEEGAANKGAENKGAENKGAEQNGDGGAGHGDGGDAGGTRGGDPSPPAGQSRRTETGDATGPAGTSGGHRMFSSTPTMPHSLTRQPQAPVAAPPEAPAPRGDTEYGRPPQLGSGPRSDSQPFDDVASPRVADAELGRPSGPEDDFAVPVAAPEVAAAEEIESTLVNAFPAAERAGTPATGTRPDLEDLRFALLGLLALVLFGRERRRLAQR